MFYVDVKRIDFYYSIQFPFHHKLREKCQNIIVIKSQMFQL